MAVAWARSGEREAEGDGWLMYHSFPLQFARENDGVWRISGL